VARVLGLVPDLLFGSRVQGALSAAGHEVQLVGDAQTARSKAAAADVLVVDLTAGQEGADLVESMVAGSELGDTRTLAFYSHVDVATRERAERAGFDLVVPRSRMAREGAELVTRLARGDGSESLTRARD
jgi:DNA-binding NarL/FixJ family response regulator